LSCKKSEEVGNRKFSAYRFTRRAINLPVSVASQCFNKKQVKLKTMKETRQKEENKRFRLRSSSHNQQKPKTRNQQQETRKDEIFKN
jgi:hypothetical protein